MKSRSAFGSTFSTTTTTANRNNSIGLRSAESLEEAASTQSCASRTAKDLISEVRHAASSLFVQRTRDLTCNEVLQERVTALTEEVSTLQRLHSDLTAEQAIIDAALEEGHQKHKERSEALKGVLAAMEQLSDDQQLCSKVFKTTERVVHSVNGFIYEVLAGGLDSSTTSISVATNSTPSSSLDAGGVRREEVLSGGNGDGGEDGSLQDDHSDADGSKRESSVLSGRGGAGRGSSHQSMAVALSVLLKNSQSFLRGRSADVFRQMTEHIRSRANEMERELGVMRVTGQPSATWPWIFPLEVLPSSEANTVGNAQHGGLRWEDQEELQPLFRILTSLERVHPQLEEECMAFLHACSFPSRSSSSSPEGIPAPMTRLDRDLPNEEEGGGSRSPLLLWAPRRPSVVPLSASHCFSSSSCEKEKERKENGVVLADHSHVVHHESTGNHQDAASILFPPSVFVMGKAEEERSRRIGCDEGPLFLGCFHSLLLPLLQGMGLEEREGADGPYFPPLPSATEDKDDGIPCLLRDMKFFLERTAKVATQKMKKMDEKAMEGVVFSPPPPPCGAIPMVLPTASATARDEEEEEKAKGEHVALPCEVIQPKDEWKRAEAPPERREAKDIEGAENEKWEVEEKRWKQMEALSTPHDPSVCSPTSSSFSSASEWPLGVPPSILSFLHVLARRMDALRVMGEVVGDHSRALGMTCTLPHCRPYFTDGLQELSQLATQIIDKSAAWQAMVLHLTQQREVFALTEAYQKDILLPSYEKELANVIALEETFQHARSQWREEHAVFLSSGEEEKDEIQPRTENGSVVVAEEGNILSSSTSSPFSPTQGDPPVSSSVLWSNTWKEWTTEYQSWRAHHEEWKRVEAALQAETEALSLAKEEWEVLAAANEDEQRTLQTEVEKEVALLAHEKALLAEQEASEALLQSQQRTLEDLQCAVVKALAHVTCDPPPPPASSSSFCPSSCMGTTTTVFPSSSSFTIGTSHGGVPPTPESPTVASVTNAEKRLEVSSAAPFSSDGGGASLSATLLHDFCAALTSSLPLRLPPRGPLAATAVAGVSVEEAELPEAEEWRAGQETAPLASIFRLPQPPFPQRSADALHRFGDALMDTYRQLEPERVDACTPQNTILVRKTEAIPMVASAFPIQAKEEEARGREEEKEEDRGPPDSVCAEKTNNAVTPLSVPLHLPEEGVVSSSNGEDTSTVLLPSCPTVDSRNPLSIASPFHDHPIPTANSLSKQGRAVHTAVDTISINIFSSTSPTFFPSVLFSSPVGEWWRKEWESRVIPSSVGEREKQDRHPAEAEEGQHPVIGVEPHGNRVEKITSLRDDVLPFLSNTPLHEFLFHIFHEKENADVSSVIARLVWRMMHTELQYRWSTERFDQFKVHIQEEICHLQEQLK